MPRYQAFFQGLKTSLPVIAGYIPVGFPFGVAAEGPQNWNCLRPVYFPFFIYAGASQFALVGF
ncbi:MAG: hypothetical protein Ct9H300mP28_12500 [Pseudomonadota bacterium]|nr:MAG: hypothetical protein Ct9H300mP28_12500 [Pseudomonadota bacterium]